MAMMGAADIKCRGKAEAEGGCGGSGHVLRRRCVECWFNSKWRLDCEGCRAGLCNKVLPEQLLLIRCKRLNLVGHRGAREWTGTGAKAGGREGA